MTEVSKLPSQRASLRSVDQLDIDIVDRLRINPLIASADLARDLGGSNATIGARIARLRELRIASVLGATPVHAAGYDVIAKVEIAVYPAAMPRLETVVQSLMQLEGVIDVTSQLAEMQLVLVIIAENLGQLDRIVLSEIGHLDEVRAVRVALLSNIHKERSDISHRRELPPTAQMRYQKLITTPLARRLDDIELRLLAEYQVDGRLSAQEAARRLDISGPSARSKIRWLRENGFLIFVTEVHPAAFGASRPVEIRIDADLRCLPVLIDTIAAHDEVSHVISILGEDHCLSVTAHALSLDNFLNQWLYGLPGVRRVKVTHFLRSYAYHTNWILNSQSAMQPLAVTDID